MNRKVTVTLDGPLKMFSSLKFTEKGITSLKPGTTITLEETGKVHRGDRTVYSLLSSITHGNA